MAAILDEYWVRGTFMQEKSTAYAVDFVYSLKDQVFRLDPFVRAEDGT